MLATAIMEQEEQKTFLEQRLDEMGKTIDWLCREIDRSYSHTYGIVKNGYKPGARLDTLRAIADAVGVPLSEFLEKHKEDESKG
jgi:hypothetical protein